MGNTLENTLWLPNGYGRGAIVFDLDGKPYEVGALLKGIGANIHEIAEVTPEYAEMRIKNGAPKLISEPTK